jgi:hypothetical protein
MAPHPGLSQAPEPKTSAEETKTVDPGLDSCCPLLCAYLDVSLLLAVLMGG